MAQSVLLLGHEKKSGFALVRLLASLGYRPMAADWQEFSPRAYRRDRPDLILVDIDRPNARPMTELAPWVRKYWGESFPIVAVTRSRKFSATSALVDAGADACLPHTASVALVERKVSRCLQGSPRPDAVSLAEETPDTLREIFSGNEALIRLGDVADVYAGATPRNAWCRRLAPPDDKWRGVITSDVLDRFFVGKPEGYLLWSRIHLFRLPPPGEYDVPEKVFLSRSGPPMVAAVDRSRLPAGTDVYSLVPKEGVGACFLTCLLNSRLLDFYFNRLANAADGRLRLETLREAPIPLPSASQARELSRIASLLSHFGPNPRDELDRQSKDELWERMEEVVFGLYGADSGIRNELAALHF